MMLGLRKLDFSLSNIQIRVMKRSIYNGHIRMFDFERTNKVMDSYNILVYTPKEREEKEESVKTYQGLLYTEKRQKIEYQIEQNTNETIERIITQICENYELPDSLIEEYRKRLQESLKLSDSNIEYLVSQR